MAGRCGGALRRGAVTGLVERGTLNQENSGSNILPAVSKLNQFRSPHVAAVHSTV